MNYKFLTNPINGEKVKINSITGIQILKKYIKYYIGGAE